MNINFWRICSAYVYKCVFLSVELVFVPMQGEGAAAVFNLMSLLVGVYKMLINVYKMYINIKCWGI